jgi:hypothetical protein
LLASEAPDPGRHYVGTPGDIISECPGDFFGIRTLARKLSDEGLNFTEILQQLRRDLAIRCERIHACVQALDRKDVKPDADGRRRASCVPILCAEEAIIMSSAVSA